MDVHGSVRNGFGVCGWCKLTKFVERYGIMSMVALNVTKLMLFRPFLALKIILIVVLGGLTVVTNSLFELAVPT